MRKRRLFLAMAAAVATIALFVCPAGAYAGELIHLTQADFDACENKSLYIDKNSEYILDEDVEGSLTAYNHWVYLNLNGHTMTTPASLNKDTLTALYQAHLYVNNGNLVQENKDKSVAYVDDSYATFVLGSGYSATSRDHICINVERGAATLVSGTYTNSNIGESGEVGSGANEPVLRAGIGVLHFWEGWKAYYWGKVVIGDSAGAGVSIIREGGSPIATDSYDTRVNDGGSIFFYDGKTNAYPTGVTDLSANKALYCPMYSSGNYYVGDAETVKASSFAYVEDDTFGAVYFQQDGDAEKYAEDNGIDPSKVHSLSFTVTFDADGGTPEPASQGRHYGQKVEEPTVSKEDYEFRGWTYDDTGAYWDFSNKVTSDLSLKADWVYMAVKIGDTYYGSLQDAVNAAKDGDTITLCRDLTESVTIGSDASASLIKIDLNGHTLTGNGDSAIKLATTHDLTLVNGTVATTAKDCIRLEQKSSGSTVNLGGGEHGLTLTCDDANDKTSACVYLFKSDSTVNFLSGTYSCTRDSAAVIAGAKSAKFNVSGGTFASGTEKTISASAGSVSVSAGSIAGHAGKSNDASITVTGGTFGDNANADDVDATTYHMLQNAEGKYVVSAHELKTVIDKTPTETEAGSRHDECTVEGCDYQSAAEEIPAATDLTAPVITGLAAGASYDVSKTFAATDKSDFYVTVAGKQVPQNADGSFTLPFGENMSVVATDVYGNASEPIVVSNYKDHDWASWKDNGDGTHTGTCSHADCETKTTAETHSGGKATCMDQATCAKCGVSYGEKDPDNHVGVSEGWGSDSEDHWRTCSGCDGVYPNTTAAHDFETVIVKEPTETEDGSKYQKCTVCGYKTEPEPIPATGSAPAILDIEDGDTCDLEDNIPLFRVSAANLASVTVGGKVVEASAAGTYPIETAGEDIEIVATDANGKSTSIKVTCYEKHDWSDWVATGDETHYRYCEHSGCLGFVEEDCYGGSATCVSQAECAVCGSSFGDIDSTNHAGAKTWHHNATEHWQTCDDCGEEVPGSRSEHTITTSHDESLHWDWCTSCDYVGDEVEHSLEQKSDDEGHWEECADCSYATEKVAHSLEWQSDEDGHWQSCSDCDYKTEKTAHALTWVTTKEATATEDGLKHQECSECGYKGSDVVIPATGDDSDDPDKGGSDDKGGSGEKGSGSKDGTVIPQTGDVTDIASAVAAVGAALAGMGALRRRK